MAGEGSDPRPKKPPAHASAEHVQCTYIVQCTHLLGAMAMCQFKLHIRDNFFSQTMCSKSDFFNFMTKSAPTDANLFLSINISNSDNLNSTTSNFKLASAKARVESVIDKSMTVWTDTMVQPAPLQTVIDWSMTVF